MKNPDFYLTSTEGYGLEEPRECKIIRRISTPNRRDLLLIRIFPSLIGQKYGLGDRDIDVVLVAPRFKEDSLDPIEWPLHVHVARLLVNLDEGVNMLSEDSFETIAWAELYSSKEAAEKK